MRDLAIRCQGLAKQYRIGEREIYRSLRDALTQAVRTPLRRVRTALRGDGWGASGEPMIWALKDVSFDVQRGEVVGIIGRNGAGKSTLLKMLSRITWPTRGSADIYGRVGSLLEVGTGFHPELTGRENVYLNGAILGMKKAEVARKFDEIVAFAELEKFIDTPVKRYSSGMYMRLAFAVAAHLETEIMLVDEVLAVGDAQFQSKCLGKMQDVSRGGRTVVFVSHSMSAIRRLCTRAILLSGGKVEIDGSVQSATEAYLSNDVGEDFVGKANLSKPAITYATVRWSRQHGMLLDVTFDGPVKITPPILGFVLYDCLGTAVFGSNAIFDHHDGRPHSMQKGTISVRVDTAALQPGTYYVSLWLSDLHELFFHADRVLRLELDPGANDDGRPPVAEIGSVRLKTQWLYNAEDSARAGLPAAAL